MLSSLDFIRLSLELNLFFARIAKEHSIFLEAAFTPISSNLANEADNFKIQFEKLLAETLTLSNGVIDPQAVSSGEFVTPMTLSAERATQFYTGIPINSAITQSEMMLMGNVSPMYMPILEARVYNLNQQAIILATALANFKARILNDVLACRLFTTNYPLLIDHILREAKFYIQLLSRLQKREGVDAPDALLEQEVFWNRIMAEHAKFIRGLLDPTEEDLFNTANNFGKEFDQLTKEAVAATQSPNELSRVTEDSLKATTAIRDFKRQGTQGLLECKIKSITVPLLGDHVLREANHYLRLLKQFKTIS